MPSRRGACFLSCCRPADVGLGGVPSCADECDVTKTGNPSNSCSGGLIGDGGSEPLNAISAELAKQCGIDVDCKGPGLADGNTSISGVQSVDAIFTTVVR